MLFSWTSAIGVMFLALLALVILMRILRRTRRTVGRPAETDHSVESLHALFRQGKLTREEFERARASILSRRPSETSGQGPRRQGFEVLEPRDHF